MATDALSNNTGALLGIFTGSYGLFTLILMVFYIIGMWKIFEKAGQPGWASLIPIYNVYILLKIIARPWWWLLLLLIPLVNFVVAIIMTWNLAKAFDKGVGFFIGLLFLPYIFYLILGFGGAQYRGAQA